MAAHQLTAPSALMQPVMYNGEPYFTSQYFHQQYLTNSPHGGKYRQHSDFLRAMKSIDAYQEHLDSGAAVEIAWIPRRDWTKADSALVQQIKNLENLFLLIGYRTLYLFNRVGQAMLSHHLDDDISKQLSVAINTRAARQASTATVLPTSHAKIIFADILDIGRMLGTAEHIVQQEAVKLVARETGVDLRPLLAAAPAQQQIAAADMMLEPTDLAKALGWGDNKGAAMNRALAGLGWQVPRIGGGWEATPAGDAYAAAHAWTSGHSTKSGYNYKWSLGAVRQALGA